MSVAQRFGLGHKVQAARVVARHLGIGRFVTGANDHTDSVYPGLDNFVDQDMEHRPFYTIPVDEHLQRQRTLFASRRGNQGFGDFHRVSWFRISFRFKVLRVMPDSHVCLKTESLNT